MSWLDVDTFVDLIESVKFRFGQFLILDLGRQELLFILNFCRIVFLLALLKQLTNELLVRMIHQRKFMHLASFSDGYQLGLNQGKFLEKFVRGLRVWFGLQRFCTHCTLRE